MRGLKTQESGKFQNFFALIQEEANKQHAIFFADAGDGHDLVTQGMECEDMMGWLIPFTLSAVFERLWKEDKVDDRWSDYYTWAVWYIDEGTVKIKFENG